jgi:PAS domain S-box-containing protein
MYSLQNISNQSSKTGIDSMLPSTIKQSVVTLTGNSELAEDTLRIREERFRSIADNNNVWVWETDATGTYTFASQAVEKILGYTPSEVVGMNYLDFADPQDKPSVEQVGQQAQQKQPFLRFVYRGKHKNGSPLWLSSSGFPLIDDQGQITGYRGSTIDITFFKAEEEERFVSEEKYRYIFEDALDTIFVYDIKGNILSVNNHVEEYGLTKEQVIGKQIANFVSKEYWSQIENAVIKLTRGNFIQGEIEIQTPIGNRIAEFRSKPIILGNKVVGGLAFLRDMTDRKNAEEQIIESKQKFESLFNANPDAALFVDNDFHIVEANTQFTKLFGYTFDELKGKSIDMVVTANELEESQRIRKIIIATPMETITIRHRKDGTEIHVLMSGAPVIVKSKLIGVVMVYKDISSILYANERLSEALGRAELLNEKLSVIGGFTRHDVRNKLMAISGNVYLAEKYAGDGDRLLASLSRIKGTVNNITSILNFAKDFEMLGNQTLVDIDVGKALDEAISLFSDPKVTITNDCRGFKVRADAMLTTVFHNLIDNSIRYGEKVTEIKVYKKTEGNVTKIIYEDNGIGIDEETRRNLFAKGYGKGTGYGLYLIKRTCEIYGWQIQETGQAGKGVCFEFILKPA